MDDTSEPNVDSPEAIRFRVEYQCADQWQARLLYLPQTRMSMRERLRMSLLLSCLWTVFWIVTGWRFIRVHPLYLGIFFVLLAVIFLMSFLIEAVQHATCRLRLWLCSRISPAWLGQQWKIVVDGAPRFANSINRSLHIETTLRQLESPTPTDYMFDDWGGRYETPTTHVGLVWTEYKQVLENEQLFLLVCGKWNYWAIPKRVFADPDGLNMFRELLKRKIERWDLRGKAV